MNEAERWASAAAGRERSGAEAVRCMPLILIEAPSSAYPRGMLEREKHSLTNEEETFYVAVFVKPFLLSLQL